MTAMNTEHWGYLKELFKATVLVDMYIFSDPVMCIVYWSVLLMIAFDLYAYGTVLENEK